jgi:hypothetical protein
VNGEIAVTTTIHKPMTCRLNLHHRWRWLSTEDGDRFERCQKCGKDRLDSGPGVNLGFGGGY